MKIKILLLMLDMQLLNNLIKGIVFSPLFLFANYFSIYDIKHPNFSYSIEKGNYKVILSNNEKIDYRMYDGFKFFIPNFAKSINLQVLRFNSIGYINGYLSINPHILPNQIISKDTSNLKYYYTDYKTRYRQLDFLLKGKAVFYPKVTAISFEAYNIPSNKKLNKTLYFTFVKSVKNNKLKYLLYSFNMILDKKKVDSYAKKFKLLKYKDPKFKYLHTYLMNLNKQPKKLVSKKIYLPKNYTPKIDIKIAKKNKKIEKTKKIPYRLDTKRLFYMEDFPIVLDKLPPKKEFIKEVSIPKYLIIDIKENISNIEESMNNLKSYLNDKLNSKVLLFPKDVLQVVNNYFYPLEQLKDIVSTLENTKIKLNQNEEKEIKCYFDIANIDKNCYKDKDYFYKYVYFLSFQNKIPSKEAILGFGDYRVFNKIGIFYFKKGDFCNAENYFFKAYALAPKDKKGIVAHNLATLFYNENKFKGPNRVIKYLKESNLAVDYFNLGVYYYIGFGVNENDKKAYELFKKSAKLGFKKAIENVKIMEKYKIGLK